MRQRASTPEGKIKDKVKLRFTREFPSCYRFAPVQNGMGAPSLDILYCVNGWWVAIETKRPPKPGGKLPEPTPRQQTTMREIVAAGGLACLVYDEASLDEAVAAIKRHIKRQRMRAWNKANPWPKEDARRARMKYRHGITPEDYETMLHKQGGHCFFCDRVPAQEHHGVLCIDHDHETGRVRGLVCKTHNSALANFGDSVEGFLHALDYLRGPEDDDQEALPKAA